MQTESNAKQNTKFLFSLPRCSLFLSCGKTAAYRTLTRGLMAMGLLKLGLMAMELLTRGLFYGGLLKAREGETGRIPSLQRAWADEDGDGEERGGLDGEIDS